MNVAPWFLLAGVLLVFLAVSGSLLHRLPLSTAMLYLGVGALTGPWFLGMSSVDLWENTQLLETLTEVVVLLSLFTAGLKLSPGLRDKRWRLPLRLAVSSMAVTVLLISAIAWLLLDLPPGACILLGAILAPTDPVLASEVQLSHPQDQDSLRFALTGEGGLNDGSAFPLVMLGLGLLRLHDMGSWGTRWLLMDVAWAVAAGLGVGAGLGWAIGRLVLYLRREHREAVGLDDFLALGLIALSYGAALMLHAYGFLAVFAAGVALRHLERRESAGVESNKAVEAAVASPEPAVADEMAVHPEHAPAYMARAVLSFNEQLERIGELAVVTTIGALLWSIQWTAEGWWFVPALLVLVRPAAAFLGLLNSRTSQRQRWLVGWFGIRGVGSLYYLMYAINHGLPRELAEPITALTLSVVVASIVVHGVSVTPLMAAYERAIHRAKTAAARR
jgi:NhaP-type Na+/H+ or K+/H+ antiporter